MRLTIGPMAGQFYLCRGFLVIVDLFQLAQATGRMRRTRAAPGLRVNGVSRVITSLGRGSQHRRSMNIAGLGISRNHNENQTDEAAFAPKPAGAAPFEPRRAR